MTSAPQASATAVTVTVDVVALTIDDDLLKVVVIKRQAAPLKGRWQLPGLSLQSPEWLSRTATEVLSREIGLTATDLRYEQLHTYDALRRDPRGQVLSVAYWTVLAPPQVRALEPGRARLLPVDELTSARLAFDQAHAVDDAVAAVRTRLQSQALASRFCEEEFTMAQLRRVYEVIWQQVLDPANFHRKISGIPGFVEPTSLQSHDGPGRPAQLYRRGTADDLGAPLLRPSP